MPCIDLLTQTLTSRALCGEKRNRNTIGKIFRGIGKVKCETLINNGINTAIELLLYDFNDPATKYMAKCIVQKRYDDMETKLNHLKGKCNSALTKLQLDVSIFGDISAAPTVIADDGTPLQEPEDNHQEADKPEDLPRFSNLHHPNGFICHVVLC